MPIVDIHADEAFDEYYVCNVVDLANMVIGYAIIAVVVIGLFEWTGFWDK